MSLAERIDKFYNDFDPYEYADTEGSVENAEEILRKSPETVNGVWIKLPMTHIKKLLRKGNSMKT